MIDRLRDPAVFAASTLGVEPHAGQVRFLLDQEHPVKCLVGGRRSGKSHALAMEVVFHAVRSIRDRRPCRQLLVAPARDQARLLLTAVSKLLASSPLGGLIESEVESPFPEVRLPHRGLIFVRAAHEGGKLLRGHAADRAVVDEAAYLAREVVQEGLGPVLADTNGTLVLASTPTVTGTWFHEVFEKGRHGDARVASYAMRSVENPHISGDFVSAQRELLTERQFQVEYGGEFSSPNERLFGWDHVLACAIGEEEEPIAGAQYALGWDPAATKDKSGVVVVKAGTRPWSVVRMLDIRGSDYVAQVAAVIGLARRYNGARITIDGTGHGTVLRDLLRREGAWVEAVVFTPQSKATLITNLAVLLEQRQVIFPANRDLLDELARYEAHTTITGHVRFGATGSATDDLVTALSLALRSAGASVGATSFAQEHLPAFLTTSRGWTGSGLEGGNGFDDQEWITVGFDR